MEKSENNEDSATADKIKTVRAYYKLCQKQENRSVVLKEKMFFAALPSLLRDDNISVVKYVVKILVLLTEQSENIEVLLKSKELLTSLSDACENITNPSINYNLVLVSSRIRAVKESIEAKVERDSLESLATAVKEVDKSGQIPRKFVGRKSKQITIEFDPEEFNETKKREVERTLLKKKGVISVYISEHKNSPKVVLRTIPSVDVKEISQVIFNIGFEYLAQIVKVDGNEEKFEMYASDVQKNRNTEYPDYLDDDALNVDPASCVITNDMASHGGAQEGGWFNSLTSFVKTSFW